ncbi:MAG: FkbM family methyltransferase [Synechococcus sp. SB0666_bin_14]|nr:FkbM family methyltransferase [Synechococcus sp. SB0666_bin_14]MYG45983.1 FkbM family methyltransferase [Synechococcus sp. SB0675_bin_6]
MEKVDIIKIDVESYEEEVLKGARSLITRQQNLMLCMEYTKGAYSNDFLVQLFNAFSKAYLPEFNNQEIGIQFLKAYEREEILPDRNSLDIMFLKGDHFT